MVMMGVTMALVAVNVVTMMMVMAVGIMILVMVGMAFVAMSGLVLMVVIMAFVAVGALVPVVVIMVVVTVNSLVLMMVGMALVAVGALVPVMVIMAVMAVKPVSGNGFADFMGMGVGVSMIMNVFALLFLPENSHIHMCSRDPAFYGRFCLHLHARQTQFIHFSKKFFLLFRTQF